MVFQHLVFSRLLGTLTPTTYSWCERFLLFISTTQLFLLIYVKKERNKLWIMLVQQNCVQDGQPCSVCHLSLNWPWCVGSASLLADVHQCEQRFHTHFEEHLGYSCKSSVRYYLYWCRPHSLLIRPGGQLAYWSTRWSNTLSYRRHEAFGFSIVGPQLIG